MAFSVFVTEGPRIRVRAQDLLIRMFSHWATCFLSSSLGFLEIWSSCADQAALEL